MDDVLPLLRAQSPESELSSRQEDLEKLYWKHADQPRAHRAWWATTFRVANSVVPWAITIVLSLYVLRTKTWGNNRFQQSKLFPSQMTNSPAQAEIEYVVRSFEHNLVNSPIEFQDPDTVDDAWASLYDGAHTRHRANIERLLIACCCRSRRCHRNLRLRSESDPQRDNAHTAR